MNILLPLVANPQSAAKAIGGQETGLKPLVVESNEQSTQSGYASASVFSQVLIQHSATPTLLNHLQAIASASGQGNTTFQPSLSQGNPRNPELLIGSDLTENALDDSQVYRLYPFQEVSGLRKTALNALPITTSLLPARVPDASPATTNTTIPDQEKNSIFSVASLPHRGAPFVEDIPSGLSQNRRSGHEDNVLKTLAAQRFASTSIGSHNLRPSDLLPVTAVQQEGPIGFTQTRSTSPLAEKPILGISSVLNDGSSPIIENRTTIQGDLLGEPISYIKGDRAHSIVEVSNKFAALDSSGGQGVGSGMNHSPNSQSRFQEPSAFLAQGMGVRGVERGPEFPMPALQRLQMDVQISENQRVSIDVGVQNRQVYAGLVTDHAVLRNLATLFVPQLENQLADVDMELKEFSAEVRDEHEQHDHTLLNDSKDQNAQESEHGLQGTLSLPQKFQIRHAEQGLHFVA